MNFFKHTHFTYPYITFPAVLIRNCEQGKFTAYSLLCIIGSSVVIFVKGHN